MRNTRLFIFCFFLFSTLTFFCQKEAHNWYFPNNCALSFSTSPPTILGGSAINIGSGSGASVSDKNGDLLFYTNGMTVWNKQHNVMANGTGLASGLSVDQMGFAIKQPGNNNIFYIFTNYQAGNLSGGFKYSIVDMSLAAGLGSVTSMNNPLLNPGSEKVCATRHCNGTDIWIVTHEMGNNNFLSYLLTAAGLNTVPVISSIGPTYCSASPCGGGQLKFNAFGSQIADAESGYPPNGYLTLYDFDKSTGVVSNSLSLSNINDVITTEFSQDGSKLYSRDNSNFNNILQWNLCAGSAGSIISSMDTIGVSSSTAVPFGFMHLAPDGKIYISRIFSSTLSVINYPNQVGSACNFVEFGQSVGTSIAKSMPGFMSNLLQSVFTYTTLTNCAKASFSSPPVSCIQAPAITGYHWNFGDPNSGSSNTTSLTNPTHNFSGGGIYTVTSVISYSTCASDTFRLEVNIPSTPQLTLTGKQSICKNESTNIAIINSASSYTWSSGATSSSISLSPSVTAIFSVSVTFTNSCIANKVFTVTVKPCTGISELNNAEDQIRVYPNPHQNEIIIELKEVYQCVLMDYTGRVINEQKLFVGKNTLSTQENSSGIYFLRLRNETHNFTVKLIKE